MEAGAVTRNRFIDSLKGVLIFLVVYGHAIQFTGYEWQERWEDNGFWRDPVFQTIYMFHMPLFMAISGFLSVGAIGRLGFGEVVVRRFRQLMVPVFVWAVLFRSGMFLLETRGRSMPDADLAGKIAWEVGHGLWFLWAAFFSMVLTAALKRFGADGWAGSLACFAGVLLLPDWEVLANFKYTFPFFLIGYHLARRGVEEPKAAVWLVLVPLVVSCFLLWRPDTYVYVSGMGLENWRNIGVRYLSGVALSAAFVMLWRRVDRGWEPLVALGSKSLDVYIIQTYVFLLLTRVEHPLKGNFVYTCLVAPLLAAAVCWASFAGGRAIRRFPLAAAVLLGQDRARRKS